MRKFEQAKAPKYPENQSMVDFDQTAFGMLETAFLNAVENHGNGDQHSWPSYVTTGKDSP